MSLFYLSFADELRFLGAVIVRADTFLAATAEAHLRQINPGGEVLGGEIPSDAPQPPPEMLNRLLSKDEIRTIWLEAKSIREWEQEQA